MTTLYSSTLTSPLPSALTSNSIQFMENIIKNIHPNVNRISKLVMQHIINLNLNTTTTILQKQPTRLKFIPLISSARKYKQYNDHTKEIINSTSSKDDGRKKFQFWCLQQQYAFIWIILFILFGLSTCLAVRQDAAQECAFPQRWEGSWFLSGYQQSIHIKSSQFSYRGKCKASDGNKYLIVDEKGCHRCLVIYEKHKNVLQYKESECEGDSMYMDQSMNPAAMPMRSIVKSDHNRVNAGGAHPNMNGYTKLSSSDQYIMRSNDDTNDCFCRGREILQNLCDQIPGDALLYSLFREQAEPVRCPLKGPFTFTYNRGHGECKNPVSNIESCTDESRLLLNFQACPDVQGTESAAEELTCLATWKDGNSRYLVGLVSHHHAISNEERFRCFVYEKISSMMGSFNSPSLKDAEYKLAQSGDATCNGLDSAEVGSRIMTLRKPPLTERCDFPMWFKGPRHWHGLMGKLQYIYHPSEDLLLIKKQNGSIETRAFCEQINKQTANEMMAVVHHTTGCQSGFMCMMFYRRDTHIAEIQIGTPATRLEDACAPDHFDVTKLQFITLLATNPEPQICPVDGLYSLNSAIGPPHKISRHKRNHNNKGHNHHHHSEYLSTGIKRHDSFLPHNINGDEFSLSSSLSSRAVADSIYANRLFLRKSRAADIAPVRSTVPLTAVPFINHNNKKIDKRMSTTSTHNFPLKSSINIDDSVSDLLYMNSFDGDATKSRANEKIIEKFKDTKLLSLRHYVDFSDTADSHSQTFSLSQNERGHSVTESPPSFTKSSQSINILNQRNRRETPGCTVNYKDHRQLWIGCTNQNVIDVRPQCNEEGDEVYFCHGSWNENGTIFVIAKHSGTQHAVCITYQPLDGGGKNGNNKDAKLIIGDSCIRAPMKPAEHHLVANIKNFGKCGDPSSSIKIPINILLLLIPIGVSIMFIRR